MPFCPESPESLRARHAEALAEEADVESVALGLQQRPGRRRRHVFDCRDGLRLIVSREDCGRRFRGIHLSASLEPGYPLFRHLVALAAVRGPDAAAEGLRRAAEDRFADIFGPAEGLEFLGFTRDKGIPHWIVPDRPSREATP